MSIKWTADGALIYAGLGCYVAAAACFLLGRRRTGYAVYAAAFAGSVAAVAWRWASVGHVPMQALFEVSLAMSVLVLPITLFCRRYLAVGGEAADCLIAASLMFLAGFVFDASPQHLPPALRHWLFGPHVAAYMLAYVIMTKAAVPAALNLVGAAAPSGMAGYEQATYRMVLLGFPPLTLGLVLGACWGKLAWGDWWNWDPKELMALVSWLIYVAYLHLRRQFGPRVSRLGSVLVIVGLVAIVVTMFWTSLSKLLAGSLHSYAG